MLEAVGAFVPLNFNTRGDLISFVYHDLVKNEMIISESEVPSPTIPMKCVWSQQIGLIRKPASFITSIYDERRHKFWTDDGPPVPAVQAGYSNLEERIASAICILSYIKALFEIHPCYLVYRDS